MQDWWGEYLGGYPPIHACPGFVSSVRQDEYQTPTPRDNVGDWRRMASRSQAVTASRWLSFSGDPDSFAFVSH